MIHSHFIPVHPVLRVTRLKGLGKHFSRVSQSVTESSTCDAEHLNVDMLSHIQICKYVTHYHYPHGHSVTVHA